MDTRDQILRLAARLLIDCGYNGFSYARISTSLHIRNAAVHYHFPSKAELGLALVKPCANSIHQRLGLKPDAKPVKALKAYLAGFSGDSGTFLDLQIINALTTDFEHLDPAIQDATQTAIQNHINWLTRPLRRGRKRGSLTYSGKPRAQAMGLLALLMGTSRLGRLIPEPDSASLTKTALQQIIV